MPDEECNHRWVAPAWVRAHPNGRNDLPMVCRDCGIFSAMKQGDSDPIFPSVLGLVGFLGQHLGQDCTLQVNTLEFVKLTGRPK